MPRHHVIISGTGRAGTTFLVQLLTALKLDTGFDNPASNIDPISNAGMEIDIRQENAPYIVKSPWLCDRLDAVLQAEGSRLAIDHAIIPMRDLYSAAESRRTVFKRVGGHAGGSSHSTGIPGGLWLTKAPKDQEFILCRQLHKLLFALAKHDIPVTLLHFPRLVHEPEYLYRKIGFLLGSTDFDVFLERFQEVVRPELIHEFDANCCERPSTIREEDKGGPSGLFGKIGRWTRPK